MKNIKKNTKQINKDWYLLDAKGIRLGKLATIAAKYLQGKNSVNYVPNEDRGSNLIIINSKHVDVFPAKLEKKIYVSHSMYPGGFKEQTLATKLTLKPDDVIRKAIIGMMPKGKLARKMLKKLYIYPESEHKHEANKPKLILVSNNGKK